MRKDMVFRLCPNSRSVVSPGRRSTTQCVRLEEEDCGCRYTRLFVCSRTLFGRAHAYQLGSTAALQMALRKQTLCIWKHRRSAGNVSKIIDESRNRGHTNAGDLSFGSVYVCFYKEADIWTDFCSFSSLFFLVLHDSLALCAHTSLCPSVLP